MANYSSTSPYFNTGYNQYYLDLMANRPVPKERDDIRVTINQTYQYRPDLMAFDVYGEAGLWWVFYQRNPNTLSLPPWDFEAGVEIFIPKITTLQRALGL
jgi:alpha-L-fucosidase